MSVNSIGSSYQNQRYMPTKTVGTEQEKPSGSTEINQLKAEIEQAQSEMKETAKEVQKAVGENIGGSSEKVQMLQNKMQMQQQAILTKQMEIKEIKDPSKAKTEKASADGIKDRPPRFDEYVKNDKEASGAGIYSVERDENGNPVIVFDNPQKPPQEAVDPVKSPSKDEKPEEITCTVNTDRVDAEIKKLKEQQQTIAQQLRQAENPEEKAALQKQLANIESELRAKDNDAYRKQNATYTYSKES